MKNTIFEVGYDKNGELDFRIRADVTGLDFEEMNAFRAMIICGIGTMEDMWRREQASRFPAAQAK